MPVVNCVVNLSKFCDCLCASTWNSSHLYPALTYLFVIFYFVYLELATTSFQCIKLWFLRNVFPCSISHVCRVFFVNTLHVLTVERSPCSRYTDASSTFLLQKFVIARVCSPDSAKKKKFAHLRSFWSHSASSQQYLLIVCYFYRGRWVIELCFLGSQLFVVAWSSESIFHLSWFIFLVWTN